MQLDNIENLSEDSDVEVEDSAAVLMTQRLTQALNDPEMFTPTPEQDRVSIITRPHLATRMTVKTMQKNQPQAPVKNLLLLGSRA